MSPVPSPAIKNSGTIAPMVQASSNAIERELMFKLKLSDQEKVIQQQKTLLEYVDTGSHCH